MAKYVICNYLFICLFVISSEKYLNTYFPSCLKKFRVSEREHNQAKC